MKINAFNSHITFQAYKSKFSENLEDRLNSSFSLKKDVILTNEFRDVFEKHYSKEYYLGEGNFNKVYKIDDYYVMRFPNDVPRPDIRRFRKPHQNNQLNKLLKSYYGATQAKFGDVQILRNAVGDQEAIKCVTQRSGTDYNTSLEYYKNKYLPSYAQLPQAAYDNLAYDFKLMNNYKTYQGYTYSYDILNPENFIKVGNEIRVVDEIDNPDALFFTTNKLLNMLNVFMSDRAGIAYRDLDFKDVKNLHTILAKCIVAAENAGLEWGDFEQYACTYAELIHNAGIDMTITEIYDYVNEFKQEYKGNYTDKLGVYLEEIFDNHKRIDNFYDNFYI